MSSRKPSAESDGKVQEFLKPESDAASISSSPNLKRTGFLQSADVGMDVTGHDNPTFTAKGFALTNLPYKEPVGPDGKPLTHYQHKTDQVDLTMIAPPDTGLPSGPLARLILAYLSEAAVKQKTRVIKLDSTLSEMLERLGMYPNSKNIRALRDQLRAICRTSLMFVWNYERGKYKVEEAVNFPFVSHYQLWEENKRGRKSKEEPEVKVFIELSEYFYAQIQASVPLDAQTLVELKTSLAIDIYTFFSYQNYIYFREGRFYSWDELYQQFGRTYSRVRVFKQNFLKSMKTVQEKCSEFVLSEDIKGQGVWLFPVQDTASLPKPQAESEG